MNDERLLLHLYLLFICLAFYQFDYLKSLEIEEKINKIRWCQPANGALFLLSTNDKTIKYWKVGYCFYLLLSFYMVDTGFDSWFYVLEITQQSPQISWTLDFFYFFSQ